MGVGGISAIGVCFCRLHVSMAKFSPLSAFFMFGNASSLLPSPENSSKLDWALLSLCCCGLVCWGTDFSDTPRCISGIGGVQLPDFNLGVTSRLSFSSLMVGRGKDLDGPRLSDLRLPVAHSR